MFHPLVGCVLEHSYLSQNSRNPLELWTDDSIKDIGGILCLVIKVEDSYKTSTLCTIFMVLVDINVSGGLFEYVEVAMGDTVFTQSLDYVYITCICV